MPKKIVSQASRLRKRVIYKFWDVLHRSSGIPKKVVKKIFRLMPHYIRAPLHNIKKYTFLSEPRGAPNRRNDARRYLRKGVPIDSFFEIMQAKDCKYVILRWWEQLPVVTPGEDIDILIADEDRDKLDDLLVLGGEGQAFDFYTITGSRGGSYGDATYFPPHLSNAILKSRVFYKNKYYIPDDYHYFVSMAYHAIFHKGQNCHIPGFHQKPEMAPEHDYATLLKKLSYRIGGGIDINVDSLKSILEQQDFMPAPDALTLLTTLQPSLTQLQTPLFSDARGGELSLFVVRHECIKRGHLEEIRRIIVSRFFFDILFESELTEEQASELELNMRGANWEKGVYTNCGGGPAHVIVAFDYYPEPLSKKLRSKYPRFTNRRLFHCKIDLRQEVNYITGYFRAYNPVHSADNEMESLWFLRRVLSDGHYLRLLRHLEMIRSNWATKFPVLEVISKGRRAKVELVLYNGRPAIKKTFRVWAERYLQREYFAADQLRVSIGNIPRLLEKGKYYVITEYHQRKVCPANARVFRALIGSYRGELKRFVKALWSAGYAHVNLTPSNILLSDEGLFVVDFEFLYKYSDAKPGFLDSYDVIGVPVDFDGDLPAGYCRKANSFAGQWGWVFDSANRFFAD